MDPTTKRFRKRDAILNCVRSTTVHPGADWVYEHVKEAVPDISLATVYRNLNLFKEQGKIMSLGTVKGVARFDGNTEPPVHFVCRSCDSVIDLPQLAVPQSLTAEAATQTGGQVALCHLSFTGICHRGCKNSH